MMHFLVLTLVAGWLGSPVCAVPNGLGRTPPLAWSSWNYFVRTLPFHPFRRMPHCMMGSSVFTVYTMARQQYQYERVSNEVLEVQVPPLIRPLHAHCMLLMGGCGCCFVGVGGRCRGVGVGVGLPPTVSLRAQGINSLCGSLSDTVPCLSLQAEGINETIVLGIADAIVGTGLAKIGYEYVNIDAGSFNRDRDPTTGRVTCDPVKYPHGMKWLSDQLHQRGLKFGVRISPPFACHAHGHTSFHPRPQSSSSVAPSPTLLSLDAPPVI
jgi:hypothetical protein